MLAIRNSLQKNDRQEDTYEKASRIHCQFLSIINSALTKSNPAPFVRKTKGGTGAFIKELMRRSAQFLLEDGTRALSERHIESALDEMLFSGGELNSKLLGMERTT